MANDLVRFRTSALLASLLLCAVCRADQIDDFIKARMKMQHVPGIAIAIVKEGKLVRTGAYGYSNLEKKKRVRPETEFLIGSLSKQFLTAAIMCLVENGKLRLDDKISRYIQGLPSKWETITVRHLLSHTSGLVRESPGFDPTKAQSIEQVIAASHDASLLASPGSAFSYSNVGYYLVAKLIESVTGSTYTDFISQRVFLPAGLTRTGVVNWNEPKLATGYSWQRPSHVPDVKWPSVRPSGAFQSSVLDLAKWELSLDAGKVLSSARRTEMWTPTNLNDGTSCIYGLGWFVDEFRGQPHIHHGGGVPGYQSDFHRFPKQSLTVIVLANAVGVDLERIALTVAGMTCPDLTVPAEIPISDDSPNETRRVKQIVEQFAQGKVKSDCFSPRLAALLAEDLQNGLRDEMLTLGPIRSVSLLSRTVLSEGNSRRYLVTRTRRFFDTFVTCNYDKKGLITNLSISD